MVAVVHDAFEKAKKLNDLTQQAAARRLGVHQTTVGRWRKKQRPPRAKRKKVLLESLGLQRTNGKRAICGHECELMTLDGKCLECKVYELQRKGFVVIADG